MFIYKRFAILFILIAISTLLLIPRSKDEIKSSRIWRGMPQRVGLGEYFDDDNDMYNIDHNALRESTLNITNESVDESQSKDVYNHRLTNQPARFKPGIPKPAGSKYTKAVVIPKMRSENITWLEQLDLPSEVETFVYGMDDPQAALKPPKNKGHEGMAYLTYIIDHYDDLRDVSIFIHPHQKAWHNNELLNHDAGETILRLSSERVTREGYMNLRCHWKPGCPEWIHPGHVNSDSDKPEENEMAQAWSILFPSEPIPSALGSPCCAQFAVSRERIRSIPLERFVHWRKWLLTTRIRDSISGRVFEYLWAKMFTDQAVFCPDQRLCYCDGYGVCFEDDVEFDYWFEIDYQRRSAEYQLELWEKKVAALTKARSKKGGKAIIEVEDLDIPMVDEDTRLRLELNSLTEDLERRRLAAVELGRDPRARARISGREWSSADLY